MVRVRFHKAAEVLNCLLLRKLSSCFPHAYAGTSPWLTLWRWLVIYICIYTCGSGRQLTWPEGKASISEQKKKASNQKALKEQLYIALAFCTQWSPTAVTGEKERCGQGSAGTGPVISGSTQWQGQFTVLWNNPLMLVACSWEQESVLSPSSWQWLNKWQACQTSLLQGQWTWCIHHSREKSICVGHVYSLLAETMAYLIQEFSQGICWRF